jgi:hypothetical protein
LKKKLFEKVGNLGNSVFSFFLGEGWDMGPSGFEIKNLEFERGQKFGSKVLRSSFEKCKFGN